MQNFSNYYQAQALQRIQEKIKGNALIFQNLWTCCFFLALLHQSQNFQTSLLDRVNDMFCRVSSVILQSPYNQFFFTALCRMSLFKLVIVVFCMLNVTTYNNNLLKCLILFKCLQYTVSHKLQIIDDFKLS